MMGNNEFSKKCKEIVTDYFNKNHEAKITTDDVYIVWLCRILQNNKALASTTVSDGMYYEITRNGDRGEIYFDAYRKESNICIRETYTEEA